jgi:GTP cyclohydrolase II
LNDPAHPRSAAQAIDALRRGWPVRVSGADGTLDLLAIDALGDTALAAFAADRLLISGERAATLKLANQRAAAAPGPVMIALGAAEDAARLIAIADPALDLAHPMKGPFRSLTCAPDDAARAALDLARHGGLLPAFAVRAGEGAVAAETSSAAIAAFADPARLAIAARARLPVSVAEVAEIIAFRSPDDLVIGQRDGSTPVVRLHSECLTGDVFGSLKCDCGPQLDAALATIAGAQWGVLLYLRQEGRGIGLINKLRAYQLQDQGFDTVDANVRLGFPVEARDFGIAARMLDLLNIPAVRLMTNNPEKVAKLTGAGIMVTERLPLALPANPHNHRYLETKRDRTGHAL